MRIRTILIYAFFFFYLLLGLPVLAVEWVISKFNQRLADIRRLRMVQWAFRSILFIGGIKVNVTGCENVPENEAVLYIGNHRSIFDIIVTYPQCRNLTGYIAKKSVKKVPGLRLWMKRLYCLFLDRDDIKQSMKVILDAIELIKRGISVCVFPEGTRNKNRERPDELLQFKEGTFKIAQKTGCKIIPMAILGTDDIFENHLPWIHKGDVQVIYGEPIVIADLEKEDQKHLGAYCQRVVSEMIKNAMK
ncbi:MAG: lysophospholipid acyltransferase family protein [Lachnospiraceae bacterium]|nr:lysophospholipid acyltransferase family protein [Lachnospiraceae bacterium]MDD6504116.1 lysophospholipid acyltransferase family protein [Lachnospiraceae bacterium]